MVALVAAFLAGICLFQLQTALPALGWLWAMPLLVAGAWRHARLRVPAAAAAGFLWSLAWVTSFGPPGYDPAWDEPGLVAEGVVASLPELRSASSCWWKPSSPGRSRCLRPAA